MATVTLNQIAFAKSADRPASGKPSFFARIIQAMMESRQRQADREIRRVRAMIGEPKDRLDYAMLPFAGE